MCWQDDPPEICSDPDFSIDQIDPDMAAIPSLYEADLVSRLDRIHESRLT